MKNEEVVNGIKAILMTLFNDALNKVKLMKDFKDFCNTIDDNYVKAIVNEVVEQDFNAIENTYLNKCTFTFADMKKTIETIKSTLMSDTSSKNREVLMTFINYAMAYNFKIVEVVAFQQIIRMCDEHTEQTTQYLKDTYPSLSGTNISITPKYLNTPFGNRYALALAHISTFNKLLGQPEDVI